ncbi:hypothetical protein N7466_007076 [Penicillium verhagenii]|uniref:uncharacterized protein n=1 Tax=Penicillium verhagenii TaxID=1562060 RepID=UPI0025451898|nr:uncharacterized protein N7466_007076 [Penicillium verhagenii]KAJ5928120.1 hypothetical protein N7466_007076 [Penicillium verhagenii]
MDESDAPRTANATEKFPWRPGFFNYPITPDTSTPTRRPANPPSRLRSQASRVSPLLPDRESGIESPIPRHPRKVRNVGGQDKRRPQVVGGTGLLHNLMKPELKQEKSYTRYPYDKDLKLPASWENAADRATLEVDATDSTQLRDLIASFYQPPIIRKQFRRVYTSEGLLKSKYFPAMDLVDLHPDLKKSLRRNNSVFETYQEHPHFYTLFLENQ